MNKQNYAVCCYTCKHNGQETCKGCNVILNGENEPYENWELREDLCQKDKKIAELQHKLDVAEKALELASKCIPCKNCPHSNGAGICFIAQDIGHYQSEKDCIADKGYYFKLKAEKEVKGE